MRNITNLFGMGIALLIFGCNSDDDSAVIPSISTLLYPLENAECTSGIPVSDTQSEITFEWNPTEKTETYFLYIKDLNAQTTLQYNAGENTSFEVVLKKGMPYSWYVTSKSNTNNYSKSAVWKFYNAGEGIVNYIPFPAELVSPAMSITTVGPTVDLEWIGSDVDDDIVDYKVYLDTNPNPSILLSTVTEQKIVEVSVMANTNYYWKVVTTDSSGNISTSPIFRFKTY